MVFIGTKVNTLGILNFTSDEEFSFYHEFVRSRGMESHS